MNKKEQQQVYVSPETVTIEIKAQAIICQSGGIEDSEEGNTTDWWTN